MFQIIAMRRDHAVTGDRGIVACMPWSSGPVFPLCQSMFESPITCRDSLWLYPLIGHHVVNIVLRHIYHVSPTDNACGLRSYSSCMKTCYSTIMKLTIFLTYRDAVFDR
jgi:hypothetical protein